MFTEAPWANSVCSCKQIVLWLQFGPKLVASMHCLFAVLSLKWIDVGLDSTVYQLWIHNAQPADR